MRTDKVVFSSMVAAVLALGISSCEKAEEAAEETGDAVEEVADEAADAVEQTSDELDKAI